MACSVIRKKYSQEEKS